MSLDQHVSVTALINSAGVALQGFGTIGILSYKALWPERKRVYGRLADLIADGFESDSPEALALAAIMSQTPPPRQVAILRGARVPTQRYDLLVNAVHDEHDYVIEVSGEGFETTTLTVASDDNATADEIIAAFVTALNGVADKNYTASAVVDASGDDMLRVVGDAPGNWFAIRVLNTADLSIAQTHADPGVADDLDEIKVADDDWYYLYTLFNSSAMVLSTAAWIESAGFKFYLGETSDSDCENSVLAEEGVDVANALVALGYKRTHLLYSRKPEEMRHARLGGRLAPLPVGSWTAAYKTLTGATTDTFTSTQAGNLDNKRTSYYKREAQRGIVWEGKVGALDYGFMDLVVAVDFAVDLIQKRIFGVFVAMPKVGFSDEDIAMLEGAGQGALDVLKSDKHKIASRGTEGDPDDPIPTFTFPRVADLDPETRASRELPDGNARFRAVGAVHSVLVDLNVTF